MSIKLYIELTFLTLLGAFTSLSLPPFNFVIINFFTFSLFYIFLKKKSDIISNRKKFLIYGWFFGFGYFLSNIYWITIALTFDESFKLLIPFSILLIPGFLAIFYALVAYLFVVFRPKKNLPSFFLFSIIFGILEFLRGSILTGFPWNLISYSLSNHLEIININSIIGTYSLNLFCISLFTSPSIFFLKQNKKEIFLFVVFLIFTTSFFIYGSNNIKKFNDNEIINLDYKVRIVGSNISINRFYSSKEPVNVIKDLIKISDPPNDDKVVFIWPEGILPNISQSQLIEYDWLFKEKFNENHLILLGINSQISENDKIKYFNTLSVYDHDINLIDSYNKNNLVPFGEFLPLETILKKIGFKTITNYYQSFSRGNERNIIDLNQKNFSLRILPLICYEMIYSGRILKNTDFDIIVNLSEDGWFGKSIGPKQHFVHSIYRAIESGKYVLRSANNGKTAIINPVGVVEKQLDFNESGYIDYNEQRKTDTTIFSKYGNKIFGFFILLYIFLIFSFNRM